MVKRKEKIDDPLKLLLPGVIPNKLCCLPNNPRTEDKKISGNRKITALWLRQDSNLEPLDP